MCKYIVQVLECISLGNNDGKRLLVCLFCYLCIFSQVWSKSFVSWFIYRVIRVLSYILDQVCYPRWFVNLFSKSLVYLFIQSVLVNFSLAVVQITEKSP